MEVLSIVLPLLLILVAGYISARFNYLDKALSSYLSTYFLRVSVPALLMTTVANEDLATILSVWKFFTVTLGIFAVLYVLGFIYMFKKNKSLGESVFFAHSCVGVNAGMIVLPVMLRILGPESMKYVTVALLIVCLFIVPFTLILSEYFLAKEKEGSFFLCVKRAFIGTLKTPFILAIGVAFLFCFFHIPLPNFLHDAFSVLAMASISIALFSVGMEVEFSELKEGFKLIVFACVVKLLLFPFFALLAAWFFNFSEIESAAIVILSSAPTAKHLFAFCKKYKTFEKEGAAVVQVTTTLSIFTISGFLVFINYFWPSVIVK